MRGTGGGRTVLGEKSKGHRKRRLDRKTNAYWGVKEGWEKQKKNRGDRGQWASKKEERVMAN